MVTIPHQAQAQQRACRPRSLPWRCNRGTQGQLQSGSRDEASAWWKPSLASLVQQRQLQPRSEDQLRVRLWVAATATAVGFTGEFLYLVKKETLGTSEAKHKALEILHLHLNLGSRNKNNIMGIRHPGPVFTINVRTN